MANTPEPEGSTIRITVTPEGQCWADAPRTELALMLRTLADQLDAGWYATFTDLPEALHDSNGNPTGTVEVRLAPDADPRTWRYWLAQLPDLADAHGADLKVDNGLTRVWLSRLGLADGEPYPHTVHVEVLSDEADGWASVGYYDADEPDLRPWPDTAGDALELTRQAVRLNERHGL